MSEQLDLSVAELLADRTRIHDAICRAVRAAVFDHARAGRPVATWENGKVVWIQPDEMLARLGERPTMTRNSGE